MLCFRKLLVAKKFMHKRGVVSGSSVDKFLSYSAEKIRRGTLLCFTEFPVSKKFMEKRAGVGTRISVEKFLSHSAEKFVGESISVSIFLGTDNFYASEG